MARDFNGSSSDIALGDFPVSESRSALSMAIWVNLDTLADNLVFFAKGTSATSRLLFLLSAVGKGTNNDLQVTIGNGADTDGYTTSNLISTGAWIHIGFAFDGGGATNADRLKIYINGVAQTLTFTGTIPATTPANAVNAFIGQYSSGALWLDGRAAEFAVWQRALVTEWPALALGYSPGFFRLNRVFYADMIRPVFDRHGGTATDDTAGVAVHPRMIYPTGPQMHFVAPPVPITRAFAFNFG